MNIVRQQVALWGKLIHPTTQQPIAGAHIEIIASPSAFQKGLPIWQELYGENWATMWPRPDRTLTTSDGLFHFNDLPTSDTETYTIKASFPDGDIHPRLSRPVKVQHHPTYQDTDPAKIKAIQLFQDITSDNLPKNGCKLWLQADDLNYREHEPVNFWQDLSPAKNNAILTNGRTPPLYSVNAINGFPAVIFDGKDNSLDLIKPLDTTATSHTFFFIYDHHPENRPHSNYLISIWQNRNLRTLTLDGASNATAPTIRWNQGKVADWCIVKQAISGPQIVSFTFDSTAKTCTVHRNAIQLASACTTPYTPITLQGKDSHIGAGRLGDNCYFNGAIAAIIYYNRVLPDSERRTIQQYLSQCYGIPLT